MTPDGYRILLVASIVVLHVLGGYVIIDAVRATRRPRTRAFELRRWRWRLYAAIGATAAGFSAIVCVLWVMMEANRYVG